MSRNSIASYSPVDAPEGTEDLPRCPDRVITSTSIVGLPLESNISLAYIFSIAEFNFYSRKLDSQIRFERKNHPIAIICNLYIGTIKILIN